MKLFEIANKEFDQAKFERDCAYYLEQMGQSAKSAWLFRGMARGDSTAVNRIRPFRQRAHSTSMPPGVHAALNELFAEEFGHPFRNGLFATGRKGSASGYGDGEPFVIVPGGRFTWLCCPEIHDLYGEYYSMRDEYGHEQAAADIVSMAKRAKWKHGKDLPGCLASGSEVMLWCPDGYYVFDQDNLPGAIS